MIHYYFRSVKEDALQKLEEPKPGVWVHIESPTEDELRTVAERHGVELDLLQDAVDFYEVPRFEAHEGNAYFYTRFPTEISSEVSTAPILLIVTKSEVLSVARTHPAFLDKYIEGKVALYTTQRTKLFLVLVDAINKHYRSNLMRIRRDVQRSRVNLRTIRNRDIESLVIIESALNDFVSALVPTNAALKTVLSGKHVQLYEDDVDLIEDIQLENQQIVESAKANLKNIQNIRDAYTAIVTNNLNQVIKFLTSLTIILTIPTLIGSLYGMNVMLPFADSPYAFFGLATIITAGMVALGYYFSKKEWL